MRKRSGQVHSRESSATLQLTVSLLYPAVLLAVANKVMYIKQLKMRDLDQRT